MSAAAHASGKSGVVDVALFAVGWAIGWMLLWHLRPLPEPSSERAAIAVVIPARNEAGALPQLLPVLVGQLRPGDELVVVDDHSTDATAAVATSLGATVTTPPPLGDGWLGKPNACWHGAGATSAPLLVFVDADVRPAPDLLDRLASASASNPDAVVSVQPWHATGRWVEQASLLPNVTALMGSGAFTLAGHRWSPTVAFGPVLALRRDVYERVGGHGDPTIRTMHTEDIGLARAVGHSELYTGRPDTTFRMYPAGARELLDGWTRSIATGARFTPWWLSVLVACWVWSLAGGWLVEPLLYPFSAVQVWVLGRRAGSFRLVTALLYPLAVIAFVVIFVRSAVAVIFRRQVAWKQRSVAARTE